jgi:hypothetical protein
MRRTVFCICPAEWQDTILPTVTEEAGPDWQSNSSIEIWWLPPSELRNDKNNQRRVTERIKRGDACEILLVGDIQYSGSSVPTPTTVVRRIEDPKSFREQIGPILEANGVDLLTERTQYLYRRWETFTVTRDHVAQWLGQFRQLGDFEWVGKGVLATLQCFSTPELVELLGLNTLTSSDQIRFYSPHNDPLGSSTTLAHAVSKGLGADRVLRFDVSDVREWSGTSILMEDCSISGTELLEFLDETVCAADASVDDRLIKISLRFAVIANGARERITLELPRRHLLNFRLDTTRSKILQTLTQDGIDALRDGRFYSSEGRYCLNPKRFISYEIFGDLKYWGAKQRAESARKLLRRVGERLYRADYSKRKNGDTSSRSEEWFKQAGLGAGGLGLNIALARSVPKSTLPVVWAQGTIEWYGKKIDWMPLLPHYGNSGL